MGGGGGEPGDEAITDWRLGLATTYGCDLDLHVAVCWVTELQLVSIHFLLNHCYSRCVCVCVCAYYCVMFPILATAFKT